jgi:O-antigen ligase
VLAVLVAWSGAATLVGALQFAGVDVAGPWPSGFRQPSFLGPHDFAALSGATLAVAAAAFALRATLVPPALAAAAALFGAVGFVVAGSVFALVGIGAGMAATLAVARLRGDLRPRVALGLAALLAVTALGTVAIRAGDLGEFLRFTGVREERAQTTADVQTYAHHTVLAYIGLQIFLDHPLVGVGWGGSSDEPAYGPQLADARREFPRAAPESFPSPEHPWGVQNAYVQALADLGIVGFLLLAAALATAFVAGARAALRSPPAAAFAAAVALSWLLVAAAVLAAVGLVAGLPVDGLLWLAVGLGAAAAAWRREALP